MPSGPSALLLGVVRGMVGARSLLGVSKRRDPEGSPAQRDDPDDDQRPIADRAADGQRRESSPCSDERWKGATCDEGEHSDERGASTRLL